MHSTCSHCSRILEFTGEPPKFCAYCGQPLGAGGSVETPTEPDPSAGPVPEGSGIDETVAYASGRRRAAPDEVPESLAGYKILRHLGRGGMGSVYQAEEEVGGRLVALKLVAPDAIDSPEALERFRQEGRLASTIAHPRCVFVYAADEADDRPYIVMELMKGSTLQDVVEGMGPLPITNAVARILDVIDGLRAAHALGVIHRDVKPSNCFLDDEDRVKVGDFGLAKSIGHDAKLTRTGSFLGTPLYASPEQIKGEAIDERTDVYSVAATLYYLLVGQAPFQGKDAAATLARIVSEPVPPPRSIRPEVPADLERVLIRALDRNRDRRHRDLSELREALQPFASGRLAIGGLGRRIAAYLLDVHASKFLLITAWNLANATLGGLPPTGPQLLRTTVLLDLAVIAVFYGVMESWLGWSPGKWLMRLRVRGQGITVPGPGRVWQRTLIFWALTALPWSALVLAGAGRIGTLSLEVLATPLRLIGLAIVCASMRRGNGFRGLHELGSGTRVVSLPRQERRRVAGRRRPIGRDRGSASRPVGVMQKIGPYKVRGSVRWEEGRRVLAAEDSSLGREAWVVLRPKASPAPDAHRRSLSRPTRPRWLAGGEQAEGRWDAYTAPDGCPLADLAGADGLPWSEARPILVDLADELGAAVEDGTLPSGLSTDQVWIQTDGVVMFVDSLSRERPAGEGAGEGEDRALGLLSRAAALALEGGRFRSDEDPQTIRAAVPMHARPILDRLVGGPNAYRRVAEVRGDLEMTGELETEVTRAQRSIHLGMGAAASFLACFVMIGTVVLAVRGDLSWPGASDTGELPEAAIRAEQARLAAWVVVSAAITLIIWTALTEGGLALRFAGLSLVRRDGRPAGILRPALRALVVWAGPVALLFTSLELARRSLPLWTSYTAVGLAVALLVAYLPLGLVDPAKGPHDRLAGTRIVPR